MDDVALGDDAEHPGAVLAHDQGADVLVPQQTRARGDARARGRGLDGRTLDLEDRGDFHGAPPYRRRDWWLLIGSATHHDEASVGVPAASSGSSSQAGPDKARSGLPARSFKKRRRMRYLSSQTFL